MGFEKIPSPLSSLQFALLVAMFVLLAAGGYALNDYYDIGMDEINKPGKTVLRQKIKLSVGLNWFFIFTALGLAVGFVLAFMLQNMTLYFVPVFLAALYWFYSTKYKREFLSGNLVVSLMASLNILIIYIYYIMAFIKSGSIPVIMMPYINTITVVYAAFAFYITFIREVAKDIPDMKGDKEFNCSNIPIKYGIKNKHGINCFINCFLAALAIFAWNTYVTKRSYLMYYIFICVDSVLAVCCYCKFH